MQEYFLHILKFFLHVLEENKICRNISYMCRKHTSYTCKKKIKCGRIFPTGVGTIFPALFKVQEAFNKSEPLFSHIHGHLKKKVSYLPWNMLLVSWEIFI